MAKAKTEALELIKKLPDDDDGRDHGRAVL
jgi:hypothetical protein